MKTDIDLQVMKIYAEKTGGVIINNTHIKWAGPPEAPKNALVIPLSDLGCDKNLCPFRLSIQPGRKNYLDTKGG